MAKLALCWSDLIVLTGKWCEILFSSPEIENTDCERWLSLPGVAELCERLHHFKETNIYSQHNHKQGYLVLNISGGQHLMYYKSVKGKRETFSNQFLCLHILFMSIYPQWVEHIMFCIITDSLFIIVVFVLLIPLQFKKIGRLLSTFREWWRKT